MAWSVAGRRDSVDSRDDLRFTLEHIDLRLNQRQGLACRVNQDHLNLPGYVYPSEVDFLGAPEVPLFFPHYKARIRKGRFRLGIDSSSDVIQVPMSQFATIDELSVPGGGTDGRQLEQDVPHAESGRAVTNRKHWLPSLCLKRARFESCFQEEPTSFPNYTLSDPGAYPNAPLSGQLTRRVTRPQAEPKDEGERQQREKLRDLMAQVRQGAEKKRARERL
jgi:hypothetical protein